MDFGKVVGWVLKKLVSWILEKLVELVQGHPGLPDETGSRLNATAPVFELRQKAQNKPRFVITKRGLYLFNLFRQS